MIRWAHVKTIFHKEFLDTVRDKKTLLMNLGLPIVVWPVLAVFLTEFAASQMARQQERVSRIALVGDNVEPLAAAVAKQTQINLVHLAKGLTWDFSEPVEHSVPGKRGQRRAEEAPKSPGHRQVEALIQDDMIDLVIVCETEHAGPYTNKRLRILADYTIPHSAAAAGRAEKLLERLAQDALAVRLEALGLAQAQLEPWGVTSEDVAPMQKTVATVAGRVLPLLLIVLIVLGGFYPAIIMTAGEKEHGTLPTLLCAPINHLELMFGKYLAILVQALTGVFTNLISIMAVVQLGLGDLPIAASPMIFLGAFIALIPVAMLYTALFMTVAIFANSFREAQNLLSPFTFVAIIPAYAALLPGIKLTALTALAPGLNITLLIKQMMVQDLTPMLAIMTLVSNLFWTVVVLTFAARLFASEQVLLAGRKGIADVLTVNRNALPHPDQRIALIYFCCILVSTVYLSGVLASIDLALYMLVAQLGVYFCGGFAIVRYFKMSAKRVFRLRAPRPLAMIGAVLIGCSLFLPNLWIAQLTPMPAAFEKALTEALRLTDTTYPIWALLLLVAFLPALCEEFAFRGLILSGLRADMKPVTAILLTAFGFALAHFSSFRMLPLFITGLILTYAAWRTGSIWVGFTIHLLNNGIAVLLVRHGEVIQETFGLSEDFQPPLPWILAATGVCVLGIFLISISGAEPEEIDCTKPLAYTT